MGTISLAQLEQFKGSLLHKDIRKTFLLRLSLVRDELENPESTHESDLRNKGRAEELRFAADIVDLLIMDAEEDIAQEKEVEDDDS